MAIQGMVRREEEGSRKVKRGGVILIKDKTSRPWRAALAIFNDCLLRLTPLYLSFPWGVRRRRPLKKARARGQLFILPVFYLRPLYLCFFKRP